MNQKNSIQAEIAALRAAYEAEKKKIRAHYEPLVDKCRGAVRAAESFDYTSEYKAAYRAVLAEMERVVMQYGKILEGTPYVQASLPAILEGLKPTPIEKGKVEERFAALIQECARLAEWLDKGEVTEQLGGLDSLCRALVDLRDIVSRADVLLSESGLPEAKRRAAVTAAQDALEDVTDEFDLAMRSESLTCYGRITALREEILRLASDHNRLLIGNDPADREHGYRFIVAFRKVAFPEEDAAFVTDVLGVSPDCLNKEPVFFDPEGAHSGGSIVIKAHKPFFAARESTLVRNLYYSMAVTPPKNCFRLAAVERGRKSPWLRALFFDSQKISDTMSYRLGGDRNAIGFSYDKEGSVSTKDLLGAIFQTHQDRLVELRDGLYEYNRSADHMPEPCIGLFIHGYPSGFENYTDPEGTDEHTLHTLQRQGGQDGIYTVILHNVDAPMPEPTHAPMPLEENALVIDCTDPDHPLIDGQEVDLDIRTPDFDEAEYLKKIKVYYQPQDIFYLDELLADAPEAQSKPRPYLEDFNLRFPIGVWDNQTAYMEYKAGSEENTLIIGGSETGKSSMLHTFILSCASCYSPEEVIFYLADFKAEGIAPEFSHYVRTETLDNLYIPHVQYFQERCDTSGALDMLGMIERVYKERNRLMQRYGKEDFKGYNQLPEVKSGKLPPMPMLFFIIDEAQAMVGENKSQTLSDYLQNRILNQVRNAGMAVIMVAQEKNDATNALFGSGTNVHRRMVIGRKTNKATLSSLFHWNVEHFVKEEYLNSHVSFLSPDVKGRMVFGTKSECGHVFVGFAGGASSERAKAIARRIREKYALLPDGTPRTYHQVRGGSEAVVPITTDLSSYVAVHSQSENPKDFSLCLGITSTGGLPSMMELSREPAAGPAYIAVMREEKLSKVARNAMFAFLYRSAGQYRYEKPRITYCANVPDTAATIGAYLDAFPYLGEHIAVVSDFVERSRVLLRAKKLFDEREHINNTTVDATFTPYLIVLHNVEWIGSEKSRPASGMHKALAGATASSGDVAETAAARESALPIGVKDPMAHLGLVDFARFAEMDLSDAPKPDEDFADFTAGEVKSAFNVLYEKGNRYGIYLLALSATKEDLQNVLGRAEDHCHGIFDSLEHMDGGPASTDAKTANVCHLCTNETPEGRKTRLYDYTPRTQAAFWTALEERLSGEA